MFDTALAYGNESGIGNVIAESGVPRKEFFITGNIPNREAYISSRESVRKSVEGSLERLRTDYFDLFLIHRPWEDKEQVVRVWHNLEELMQEGKIRAIGVSNFDIEQLKILMDAGDIIPAVNQVRCNPRVWNSEIIAFCKENGIQPMAHSPLNFSDDEYRLKLTAVGQKYGKSWAQVLLRYDFERGICTIPKSSNPINQVANLKIFDFKLKNEDMALLSIQ